jgi:hypothetical protein
MILIAMAPQIRPLRNWLAKRLRGFTLCKRAAPIISWDIRSAA